MKVAGDLANQSNATYSAARLRMRSSCDSLYGKLLIFEWLATVVVACMVSPWTWSGSSRSLHPHVFMALTLGFLVAAVPGLMALKMAGKEWVAYLVGVAQMLLTGLLVHVTNGRIETHFSYFASLALLAAYRDWRILIVASFVAAVDHLVRGIWLPVSIFGVEGVDIRRVVEHAWWVIWEDIFLIRACNQGEFELRLSSSQSGALKAAVESGSSSTASLLNAARALNEVSAEMDISTHRVTKETLGSLRRARAVSERIGAVANSVSSMRGSAQDVFLRASDASNLAAQSSQAVSAANIDMQRLVESGRQIEKVVETIQTLAWQTNLLSVNASIEAARAGEYGKGFAVVAEEVRALSNASQRSSANIQQDVLAVRENTRQVAARLKEVSESVKQISELATIITQATHVQVANAASIGQNAAEMITDTRQIVESIEDLSRSSETTARASERTGQSANEIQALALSMSDALGLS